MSKMPTMQELLEAGVHFGHQVRRWNPKMKGFIFAARDGVHVINLEHTVTKLEEAVDFVKKIGEAGGTIIFLGSKKQAKNNYNVPDLTSERRCSYRSTSIGCKTHSMKT